MFFRRFFFFESVNSEFGCMQLELFWLKLTGFIYGVFIYRQKNRMATPGIKTTREFFT